MTAKTVLNIHPKVFYAVAAGAGFSILTAVGTHIDPSILTFLPAEYRASAATLAGVLISGIAGWLKRESADETTAEKAVSDDIASGVGHVVSLVDPAASVPVTVTTGDTPPPAA